MTEPDAEAEGRPTAPRRGLPPEGVDDPRVESAAEILSQVSLRSLSVTPEAIVPFGVALVRWAVDGPPRGFALELNGQRVTRTGERPVQPLSSTAYTLVAVARGARRRLGSVDLNVDLSRCETFEPPLDIRGNMEGALARAIETEDIFLRRRPSVTFAPGRISFRLELGKRLDRQPDPTIRIDASFGLQVRDGELVAVGEVVDADVSVPVWVRLLPGAVVWLPIVLGSARQRALAGGRRAITDLVRLIAFWWTPARGMRRHSIRIAVADDGYGILRQTECPSENLLNLVALAGERTEAQDEPEQG